MLAAEAASIMELVVQGQLVVQAAAALADNLMLELLMAALVQMV
tara:strand:- start:143 stop:274 length:132 start_codon:yes stop_codon:yes gene_type:complete